MRITNINNYTPNATKKQNNPNFKAQLLLSSEVEKFMNFQAFRASRGNNEVKNAILADFYGMLNKLQQKIRPLGPKNSTVAIVLSPALQEYFNTPVEKRGDFTGKQLGLIAGNPYVNGVRTVYHFDYLIGKGSLPTELAIASKNLIQKEYGKK